LVTRLPTFVPIDAVIQTVKDGSLYGPKTTPTPVSANLPDEVRRDYRPD
jgi:hypothetical protein